MDKKSTALLQEKGYTVHNKQRFRGSPNGFFVDCLLGELGTSEVTINCFIEGKEKEVATALEGLRKKRIIMNFNLRENAIHLLTGSGYTFGHALYLEATFHAIEECVKVLESLGISGTDCPICGKSMANTETAICPNGMTAHKECAEQITAEVLTKPNNYGKGCLGAVLGVLIGCVAWYLLFFADYTSTILPAVVVAVSTLLASFLWNKFGGKDDKRKIFAIVAFTFVGFLIANCAIYVAIIKMYMAGYVEGTVIDGIKFILDRDPYMLGIFFKEFAFYMLACVLGLIVAVFVILKKQKLEK